MDQHKWGVYSTPFSPKASDFYLPNPRHEPNVPEEILGTPRNYQG